MKLDTATLPLMQGPAPAPRAPLLAALRRTLAGLASCHDLDTLVATLLWHLENSFHLPHVMLLMAEADSKDIGDRKDSRRLHVLASQGYPQSGIGTEILPGQGLIDVAAREKTPIRLVQPARDYRRSHTIHPLTTRLQTDIPFPNIANSASQIAVPLLNGQELLGVLFAESPEKGRFGYDEEDALVILAAHLAAAIARLPNERPAGESDETASLTDAMPPIDDSAPLVIRHYRADDSVFVDDQYVIKGVAGAVLWLLLGEYVKSGRTEFSNKEVRLSPQIRLPEYSENLEARLILLRRRLAERSKHLGIDKTGRGRFRLTLDRSIDLIEVEAAPATD